ncbi:MAG: hypothetical protein LC115_06765 [Bacteroidia bacterium]|nr:hypothetical protein [Bacteroidia bacterium]
MLKHISVFSLVMWVLLNAVGIQVFHHICKGKEGALISFYERKEPCHPNGKTDTVPSCCESAAESCDISQQSQKKRPCCSKKNQVHHHTESSKSQNTFPCCKDELVLYQAPVHKVENFSFKLLLNYSLEVAVRFVLPVVKHSQTKYDYTQEIIPKPPNWIANRVLRL